MTQLDLQQRLEQAEDRVKALENIQLANSEIKLNLAERAKKAEAELARLKAQEPVGYICTSFMDAKEDCTLSVRLPIGTKLYAEPRPAVLPPEVTHADGPYVVVNGQLNNAWAIGANWMLERVKAPDCKVIKLAKDLNLSDFPHRSHFDYAEGYNDRAEMDRQALRELGFTVESD